MRRHHSNKTRLHNTQQRTTTQICANCRPLMQPSTRDVGYTKVQARGLVRSITRATRTPDHRDLATRAIFYIPPMQGATRALRHRHWPAQSLTHTHPRSSTNAQSGSDRCPCLCAQKDMHDTAHHDTPLNLRRVSSVTGVLHQFTERFRKITSPTHPNHAPQVAMLQLLLGLLHERGHETSQYRQSRHDRSATNKPEQSRSLCTDASRAL